MFDRAPDAVAGPSGRVTRIAGATGAHSQNRIEGRRASGRDALANGYVGDNRERGHITATPEETHAAGQLGGRTDGVLSCRRLRRHEGNGECCRFTRRWLRPAQGSRCLTRARFTGRACSRPMSLRLCTSFSWRLRSKRLSPNRWSLWSRFVALFKKAIQGSRRLTGISGYRLYRSRKFATHRQDVRRRIGRRKFRESTDKIISSTREFQPANACAGLLQAHRAPRHSAAAKGGNDNCPRFERTVHAATCSAGYRSGRRS